MEALTEGALGVVIAVPGPLAAQLHGWRASFGEAAEALVPPHVTILTHGITDDVDAAVTAVAAVAARTAPFTVVLRGTGSFLPHSPVAFLRLATGARECVDLHEGILAAGIGSGARFPYHPHVTLAQGVDRQALDEALIRFAGFAATFPARALGVFRAGEQEWEQVGEVPLGG
ncbi:phosphoesterase [Tersicoccus solisilvae]|uniref:Phosphoesterase n=1 Tax=Tersicoccus solisilvae TaxID=1882339 RepID=A0ABQ1P8D9_9MICC|nr:2'-5' RNA ligase family protein [Tersicoccus solisilvae]GGC93114.1 phosphoesterase [Tersicoccus solisilvae]